MTSHHHILPPDISTVHDGRLMRAQVSAERLVEICRGLASTCSLKLITARSVNNETVVISYIFSVRQERSFLVLDVTVTNKKFPSLINVFPNASFYEQRIHVAFGLMPVGHPQPTPSIQGVQGEGVWEVPVGPVHAGIIEPGHFRFSMLGEEIIRLEPKLQYVHKGTEALFTTLPFLETVRLAEHVAGDTAFTHSLAYCQALEDLMMISVPQRARYLRVIYSELERLANHVSDIGFMMLDTGFNFGGSHGMRLRERLMQLCEKMTGHRFLRGVVMVGGVRSDISEATKELLKKELEALEHDYNEVMAIANSNASLLNRLEGTGVVTKQVANDYGAVGVPARASGLDVDARRDVPYAAYEAVHFAVAGEQSGDVLARFRVRCQEMTASFDILRQALEQLPAGPLAASTDLKLPGNRYALGITEGWRGEIVYFVTTTAKGKLQQVAVRDPSVINWHLTPFAAQGNILLDFPLINKSFNLSYTGHDV